MQFYFAMIIKLGRIGKNVKKWKTLWVKKLYELMREFSRYILFIFYFFSVNVFVPFSPSFNTTFNRNRKQVQFWQCCLSWTHRF